MSKKKFAQVAIDSPLRKLFDYRIPDGIDKVEVGSRVLVPFGRRKVVGIIVKLIEQSDIASNRIKNIHTLLDNSTIFNQETFTLIGWAARYYHYPLGAALFSALPPALRKSQDTATDTENVWQLTDTPADNSLKRAPKQAKILAWLEQQTTATTTTTLNAQFPNSQAAIRALETRGLIRKVATVISDRSEEQPLACEIKLTNEQRLASEHVIKSLNQFKVQLLEGVTGSGKTEVYFKVISHILTHNAQAQVLILVPEIGLTPQLQTRLTKRFGINIGLLHSNTTEKQRKQTWLKIAQGDIRIILGTRLAVFTPAPQLALIIVDEEHDASLKQQEGFLYHARDVAIYRAKQLNIPIILGSATPSFESLHNASTEKFAHLHLHNRALSNAMPSIQLADMRTEHASTILSAPLGQAMKNHLAAGQQIILFLNRRGYAPALLCHDCGWVAHCERCDANMTYHRKNNKLICHHCDSTRNKHAHCPQCHSSNLIMLGHGTQRIEEALLDEFENYSTVRLDRDITRRKGLLEKILLEIQQQKHQIIIGTQILSKGHDFPNVSLVGILDIDYGIHSTDFRALERSAQLLIQVAGRSGRRDIRGEVFIQTHTPDHPLLQTLIQQGYASFAERALAARSEWKLPPYTHHIAIRARSQNNHDVFVFLEKVKSLCTQLLPDNVIIQGPINAAMEKKAGQFRAFILLIIDQRGAFTQHIDYCLEHIETLKEARPVKWSVDVDPIDNFV